LVNDRVVNQSAGAMRTEEQDPSLKGTSLWLGLADEKRQQVFQAALDEFADKGYSSASMNSLSRRAGISKGSIFSYFRSKSGLFDAVVQTAMDRVRSRLKQVRDTSSQAPFQERLLLVMESGIDFIDEHPLLARIYYQLLRTGDSPFGAAWLKKMNEEASEFLRELVEDGQSRGDLRRDLPADEVAFVLNALLDHLLAARGHMQPASEGSWSTKDRQALKQALARQVSWLMDGLRARSSEGEEPCT
jgi:AcrR family transcriptional regulator